VQLQTENQTDYQVASSEPLPTVTDSTIVVNVVNYFNTSISVNIQNTATSKRDIAFLLPGEATTYTVYTQTELNYDITYGIDNSTVNGNQTFSTNKISSIVAFVDPSGTAPVVTFTSDNADGSSSNDDWIFWVGVTIVALIMVVVVVAIAVIIIKKRSQNSYQTIDDAEGDSNNNYD